MDIRLLTDSDAAADSYWIRQLLTDDDDSNAERRCWWWWCWWWCWCLPQHQAAIDRWPRCWCWSSPSASGLPLWSRSACIKVVSNIISNIIKNVSVVVSVVISDQLQRLARGKNSRQRSRVISAGWTKRTKLTKFITPAAQPAHPSPHGCPGLRKFGHLRGLEHNSGLEIIPNKKKCFILQGLK